MAEITLTGFFKLPTGAKYFTRKDDRVYHSIDGALSFGFYDRAISMGVNRVNDLSASVIGRPWVGGTERAQEDPTVIAYPEMRDYRVTDAAAVDEQETHTMLLFMSGNDGTGNVIAMVPFNMFEQFSPAIPVRY